MITISNVLTLSRGPLAILFLLDNIFIRLLIISLAMISDGLDGFLARRFKKETVTGGFLDPIMDKFFASFAFGVLASDGHLSSWQMFALLSRDFYYLGFIIYMSVFGDWNRYQCRPVWISKVITVFQLFLMVGLTINIVFPIYIYYGFLIMGFLALVEQFLSYYSYHPSNKMRETVNSSV